jgi:hypothetical protein
MNKQEARKLQDMAVEKIAGFNREFKSLHLPKEWEKEIAILLTKYATHAFMAGFSQSVISTGSDYWGIMSWDVIREIGGVA